MIDLQQKHWIDSRSWHHLQLPLHFPNLLLCSPSHSLDHQKLLCLCLIDSKNLSMLYPMDRLVLHQR
uniref:Uncharacterized protein n=1 Tax=Populus trichocarpa TaxID=3694 RepID=A0A2K1YYV8_POPTR